MSPATWSRIGNTMLALWAFGLLVLLLVACGQLTSWPDLTKVLAVHHIDHAARIIWMETIEDAHEACLRRGGIARFGNKIAACYDPNDDVIVVHVGISQDDYDHEWCHRFGWPADHPPFKPRACYERPWRTP